jgi:hypothetical protein
LLREIAAVDSRVTVVKLRRNFGQTAGLAAGFDHARGEYIIAMDGDLQHDPADIPLFLEKIAEGYDIVSGWRKHRVDNFWLRRIPSRCANWLMAKLSGVDIHDFGTTFKAYRREILGQVPLYGELHRFIPALASWYGASIIEVPIKNVNRERGASHYGISRTFRVFFDLITIRFLLKYLSRPLHFFGTLGMFSIFAGSLHFRLADSGEDLAPHRCHVPARPADDVLRRAVAGGPEHARRRPARRNAGAPLPRARPARSVLRRSRPASAERREHHLGVIAEVKRLDCRSEKRTIPWDGFCDICNLTSAFDAHRPLTSDLSTRYNFIAAMPTTTQHELRLASRMSRLGTETAFEVLNRARALEKQGREIIHLEIGEPDFDTPANVIEAGVDALHRDGRTTVRPPVCPICARPLPTTSAAPAKSRCRAMRWWLSPAASRLFSSRFWH